MLCMERLVLPSEHARYHKAFPEVQIAPLLLHNALRFTLRMEEELTTRKQSV